MPMRERVNSQDAGGSDGGIARASAMLSAAVLVRLTASRSVLRLRDGTRKLILVRCLSRVGGVGDAHGFSRFR